MKRVVKNILQCRTVLVSTWIFFGSTIVTSKPTQPRSIPKVTDCRHRANQPRARASTMMGGSRQLLVAILAVAAIDRSAATDCGGDFDSRYCSVACILQTCSGSAGSVGCSGSMEYGSSAFNGYQYCDCHSNYSNGTIITERYCQTGPTGVGWWILVCCCMACCVSGSFLMYRSQKNSQRAAQRAADVQHDGHPGAVPQHQQQQQVAPAYYPQPGPAAPPYTGSVDVPPHIGYASAGAPPGYDAAQAAEPALPADAKQ
eukprot:m.295377 g.295377  ORF g.295377 m.295377 type:complete len:258 (+) comp27176_c2_seq1:1453-2226(+)